MKFHSLRAAVVVVLTATAVTLTQTPVVHAVVPSPFDSTFGTDGIVTHDLPLQKSQSEISEIVSDPSGNLYALLLASSGAGTEIVTVAKYSANGSSVSAFGTNGQSDEIRLSGASIALQSDGKIVVSGFQYSNNQTKLAVYRFNTNGRIDTSFGTDGAYIIPSFPGKNIWSSILLLAINQSTDRIHIAFNVSNIQDNDQNFYFIALDIDGQLDYNWSNGGAEEVVPRTGPVSAYSTLTNIQILSDGSLLGIGSAISSNGVRAIVLTKLNQNGYLDQSFDGSSNGNGVVFIPFGSESDAYMTAAVVLQDDSVVLAGSAGTYYYGPWYYGVTKILADGTVDTSFGTSGFKLSTLQTDFSTALPRRIGIQTDGRYVFPINSGTTAGFMRVETNGTFSNSPNCSQCLWSGANDGATATSLVIQADSKIVMTGSLRTAKDAIIRRFTSAGTADGTFNDGTLQINKEKWESFIGSIRPQPDGSILGFGFASANRGMSVNRGLVFKFTASGALDTQFGLGGYQFLAPPTDDYSVNIHDAQILPDGKIVILGSGRASSETSLMLWRLNSNGSLDNSFGTNGFSLTTESNTDLYPTSLLLNASGNIIIPLQKYANYVGNVWVYQFLANGTLDSSFTDAENVPGGKKPSIGDGSGNSYPNYVTPAEDGKYFVAGSTMVNSSPFVFLAKFFANGTLDTSFSGGYITWDVQQTHSFNYISNLIIHDTGKIFVFGSISSPVETSLLLQLNANGTRNSSFNGSGYALIDFRDPTQIDYSYPIDVVLENGVFTILGGGDSNPQQYRNENFSSVARMNTSGALDMNFGSGGFVDPFPTGDFSLSDIAPLTNGDYLIAGMVKVGTEMKVSLMKLGPTTSAPTTTVPPVSSPPTSAPATTLPPTTSPQLTTSTTVPATNTAADETIKLVLSVSQAAIVKRMKLTIPAGSKVVMKSSTTKVCRVVKTKVVAASTGTCRISVTVTDKKKKKTTKSTSFKVT